MPDGFNYPLVKFFVAFQLIGCILVLLLLLTALLSSTVRSHRHPTWFNFCLSWVISCIAYLLLTFAGQQTGSPPSRGLCIAQAALIYSVPSTTGWATTALVIQLWFNIKSMFSGHDVATVAHRRAKIMMLLAAPYISFAAMLVLSLTNAFTNQSTVRRATSGVYCIITTGLPGKVSAILVVIAMTVTVIFEIMVANILLHNRKRLNHIGVLKPQTLAAMFRVAAFSVFGILVIIVCLLFLSIDSVVPNILIACSPVFAALAFSTQSDIFSVWAFWKKTKTIPTFAVKRDHQHRPSVVALISSTPPEVPPKGFYTDNAE